MEGVVDWFFLKYTIIDTQNCILNNVNMDGKVLMYCGKNLMQCGKNLNGVW